MAEGTSSRARIWTGVSLVARKAWATLKQVRTSHPIATEIAMALTGAALAILVLYDYFAYRSVRGSIVLSSPTVYTRQRLVNDRLSQANWLTKQLELTEKDPDTFSSIDSYTVTSDDSNSTLSLTVGDMSSSATVNEKRQPTVPNLGSADKQTSQQSERHQNLGTRQYRIDQTTLDKFLAKNNYRDTVRTQLMQTLLDDRHDISGNTIYRLGVDSTIIGGSGEDQLAVIYVTLIHDAPQRSTLVSKLSGMFDGIENSEASLVTEEDRTVYNQ
jgi:hypothetical protein